MSAVFGTDAERAAARDAALEAALMNQRRLARPSDYVYDKTQEKFWDLQDNTLHSDKAVDASIPRERWRVEVIEPAPGARNARPREVLIPPSKDIARIESDQFVENSTWWPGKPQIIPDIFVDNAGVRAAVGRRIYNSFRPCPDPSGRGNAALAGRWLDHVKKLFPDPEVHEHFFNICAHMLQRPDQKAHTISILSGAQRIGKDSCLEPVRRAVGAWNAQDIEPDQMLSQFKPWLQTLMLVVNEAKPAADDFSAISMYNIMKPWGAAPPATLPVNDKGDKLRHIMNVLRVFITTNNYMDLHIPDDDSRMFIMHSSLQKGWHIAAGKPDYFRELWEWLEYQNGFDHVAEWLRQRDLSNFNPKMEPPRTDAWRAIGHSWSAGEDGVTSALEALGSPDVFFFRELLDGAFDHQEEFAALQRSPRKLMRRMLRAGYAFAPSPSAGGDRWDIAGSTGGRYRARSAFVRETYLAEHGMRGAHEALRARGRGFADAIAKAGMVTKNM